MSHEAGRLLPVNSDPYLAQLHVPQIIVLATRAEW